MSFLISSIKTATQAACIIEKECLQILWSGYGKILRFEVIKEDNSCRQIIVKYIQLPEAAQANHPRGWDTDTSHQRKLKSYQVESSWYKNHNTQNTLFKTPKCLGVFQEKNETVIVLEDLDASGFNGRLTQADDNQIKQVIKWLACFHAEHLIIDQKNNPYSDLWNIGTYWHLETRADEYEVLKDESLKKNAKKIDQILNDCPIQTLVHGDAKLANFCFDLKNEQVAGVDFQYIGKGVGVKDLAYFLGSCLDENELQEQAFEYLEYYLKIITEQIEDQKLAAQVEVLWRDLFTVAWVDFLRFVKGWSPDHWKINRFSEQLKKQVIKKIEKSDY